jgi:D-inositol-3-phosphate glycosyltransferase
MGKKKEQGQQLPKKTILVIGDAVAPTGFARVLHSLFVPLSKKYNVHHLGVNYRGDPHEFPYSIYPAMLGGDIYGLGRIDNLIQALKPQIIFLLNDMWVHSDYMRALEKYIGKIKIVMYSPIDAGPMDFRWLKAIQNIDRFIVYTEYAKAVIDESLETWSSIEGKDQVKFPKVEILPHGIDTKKFYPFPDTPDISGKLAAKRTLYPNRIDFLESFVVLNSNRNQPRKRIDITLKGFALFAKNKPDKVKLYLHMGIEDVGWNVVHLAQRYGIDSRLVLSSTSNTIPGVPDNRLNLIYNACDIGINTSLGEGWGLCNWEHAATKAAQIVPEHSANIEIWGDKRGVLMRPSFQLTNERILTEGKIVTPETVAQGLELLYQDKKLRDELAQNAYDYITSPKFNWKTISKTLDGILTEVLEEHPDVKEEVVNDIVAL